MALYLLTGRAAWIFCDYDRSFTTRLADYLVIIMTFFICILTFLLLLILALSILACHSHEVSRGSYAIGFIRYRCLGKPAFVGLTQTSSM